MKKLCIFDLDGTLLDTLPTIAYYVNYSLENFSLPKIEQNEFKYLAGNGAKVLIEKSLDFVKADKEKYFDKVYKFYNEAYDNNVTYLTKPFNNIEKLLTSLKENGIKTAVISNKPNFAAVSVVNLFLPSLIDIAHGARDNVKLKPSADGVFKILDEINVSKEDCLYIGDTGTDMQTGKNSGIYTVGVLWGFRKEDELWQNGADAVVSDPMEILDIAKK